MTEWTPGAAEFVTTEDELRTLIAPPAPAIERKGLAGVDAESRKFIDAARLFCVATAGRDGALDVSPRGDPAGNVLVFDDSRTIAFADRKGNRRVDTLRNLLGDPQIALAFVVPGVHEVLRVNGRARIVRSAPFFAELADKGGEPALAVVVDVRELFVHCGNAFGRSGAWEPESWAKPGTLPSGGDLLKSQLTTAERWRS